MSVFKGNLAIDPRGMIYESYRIEDISLEECRMIFLDWAMNTPNGNMKDFLNQLIDEYADENADHPMTQVIKDGLETSRSSGKRRGGRVARMLNK